MISEYVNKAKAWVLENVLWAERNLKGRSGTEKKAAVVAKLDDMIRLPAWLEWADGPVIAWLVDRACDMLNEMYGHDWGAAVMDGEEIKDTAAVMPDPDTGEDTETDGGAANAGPEKDGR